MADILYLCDKRACEKCSYPICKHTTDITHAKHFVLGMGGGEFYVEVEDINEGQIQES